VKPYRLHLFICLGKRCAAKGSEEVYEKLREKVKALGLKGEVKVSRSGCFGVCKESEVEGQYSPAAVVYPEGVWYKNLTMSDIDELIEKHLKGGEAVERLVHFRLGA